MNILFRHDTIRPAQAELMQDIYDAIASGRNILINAPTGSGKTDASLSAAITYAIENDISVFFLTPKISQHKIAIEVVNGIAKKHKLDIRAVDLVGRTHCCIHPQLQEMDSESLHTSCAKKRRDENCEYYANARGYGRIGELKSGNLFKVIMEDYGAGISHHEMIKAGIAKRACPYELLLKMAEVSKVVIADYHHIMIPSIRDTLFLKIKKRIENSIIIVDEAHNLSSRVRESLSSNVSTNTFRRMEKEMRVMGLDAGPASDEFIKWAGEILEKEDEMLLLKKDLDVYFDRFGFKTDVIAKNLEDIGMQYLERTNKKSACLKLSKFLASWKDEKYESVRMLKGKNDYFQISKKLLDPAPITKILNGCISSVLMSGTLAPLQMHMDILALDPKRTDMNTYPSPFDPKKIVNIIADKLTTRYTRRGRDEYKAMALKLDAIIAKTPGGTAIYFCSYKVMNEVLPFMETRGLNIQKPEMRPSDIRKLIRDFKAGGVLSGVQGGSLSEGVDFCDEEIKTAVIVGIPMEEMNLETKALIEYYEQLYGKGWDYGYIYPALVKSLQAAGRGRRKESDRVAVVYMDERFKWSKYNWIMDKKEKTIVTDNPEDEVERFWKK